MSTGVSAAHLHGPAAPGQSAPVVVPLTVSPTPLTGSATIAPEQEADLLAGGWYVDLHDFIHPADAMIRCQLAVIDNAEYGLSYGPRTTDSSAPTIMGTVTVDPESRQMDWDVTWSNPPGTTVDSVGFGGPATYHAYTSGIQLPLGSCNPCSGSATLDPVQVADVISGFWYFKAQDTQGTYAFSSFVLPRYPRLANISTRLQVGSGDRAAIAGLVISGLQPKTVSIVVHGPSLTQYGITTALDDPKYTLMRGSTIIAVQDGNGCGNVDCNTGTLESTEAAGFHTLDPGLYTVIVEAQGRDGVALLEVYELDQKEVPLINLSTRGQALQGESTMIAGFVIGGDEPKTVIVRGIGPSLSSYGVSGALANPTLQLVRMSDQTVIGTNDDWQDAANADAVAASGFAPSNALESAILVTLPPGAYTALLTGQGGGTGVGLVEVYAVGNK
jgi:hypothetical protein